MEEKILNVDEQKEKYLDEYEELLSSYIDLLTQLSHLPVPGKLKTKLRSGIQQIQFKQIEVRSFREEAKS